MRELQDSYTPPPPHAPPVATQIISEATRRDRALSIENIPDLSEEGDLHQTLEGLYEKRSAILSELKVQVGLVGSLHSN